MALAIRFDTGKQIARQAGSVRPLGSPEATRRRGRRLPRPLSLAIMVAVGRHGSRRDFIRETSEKRAKSSFGMWTASDALQAGALRYLLPGTQGQPQLCPMDTFVL